MPLNNRALSFSLSFFLLLVFISGIAFIGNSLIARSEGEPELIITFTEEGYSDRHAIHSNYDVTVKTAIPQIFSDHIILSAGQPIEEVTEYYESTPEVLSVEQDEPSVAVFSPNDSYFSNGTQWGPAAIHAPDAWDTATGSGTIVAIVDSGVDTSHPDLQGQLLAGTDIYDGDSDPSDGCGHGTFLSGIVAAKANNSAGIAGIAHDSQILPVKVTNDSCGSSTSRIAQGIIYAVDQGADVILIASIYPIDSTIVNNAIDYADDRDVIIVSAVGNDSSSTEQYPAAHSKVVAVTAVSESGTNWANSNYGSWIDISAPGVSVYSTYKTSSFDYIYGTGTSYAAPFVAGTAALVKEQSSCASRSTVYDALTSTATDLGSAGKDDTYGYGRVNADAALDYGSFPTCNTITEPSGLSLSLTNHTVKDPSSDGQTGSHEVRLSKSSTVIADITTDFSAERDWSSITGDTDTDSYKGVVEISGANTGASTWTLYVPKGTTNAFRACPDATNLAGVTTACSSGVQFRDSFPQVQSVSGDSVTVESITIDSVKYWKASGISTNTNFGGLGETIAVDANNNIPENNVDTDIGSGYSGQDATFTSSTESWGLGYDGAYYIGDVNGDDIDDLILGLDAENNNVTDDGSIYIRFGGSEFSGDIDVADSSSYNLKIIGETTNSHISYGPSLAIGDVNADGQEDLVFGAQNNSMWIIFSTLIDDVSGTGNEWVLTDTSKYNIKYTSLADPGEDGMIYVEDINGDTNGDVVVASGDDDEVYFIFSTLIDDVGATTGNSRSFSTPGHYNARYTNTANAIASYPTYVFDVNGDNNKDVIFLDSDETYVVFSTLTDDLAETTGNNFDLGTTSTYNIVYNKRLRNVTAGDLNNDTYSDLVFGDEQEDTQSRNNNGAAYILYSTLVDDVGTSTGNSVDLTNSANYNVRVDGSTHGVGLTSENSILVADLNGDSIEDLALGGPGYGDDYQGAVYVLYSTLLDDLTGTGNNVDLATSTNFNVRFEGRYDDSFNTDAIPSVQNNSYHLRPLTSADIDDDGNTDLFIAADNAYNYDEDKYGGAIWIISSTIIDDYADTGNSLSLGTASNYSRYYIGDNSGSDYFSGGGFRFGDLNNDTVTDFVTNEGNGWQDKLFVFYGGGVLFPPASRTVVLQSNENTDVTTSRQTSTDTVRVKKSGTPIADVSVDFTYSRDWSTVVSDTDSTNNKAVIDLNGENTGVTGTHTLYIPKGSGDSVRICPEATSLAQITSDCSGGVLFSGTFPETQTVSSDTVTVTTETINSTEYWKASGLTGTGGQSEENESVSNPVDIDLVSESEAAPELNLPSNQVTNSGAVTLGENTTTTSNVVRVELDKPSSTSNISQYYVFYKEEGSSDWDSEKIETDETGVDLTLDEGRYVWFLRTDYNDGSTAESDRYKVEVEKEEVSVVLESIAQDTSVSGEITSISEGTITADFGSTISLQFDVEGGVDTVVELWDAGQTIHYDTMVCGDGLCDHGHVLNGPYTLVIYTEDDDGNKSEERTVLITPFYNPPPAEVAVAQEAVPDASVQGVTESETVESEPMSNQTKPVEPEVVPDAETAPAPTDRSLWDRLLSIF